MPHALILSNDVEAKTVSDFVAASKKTPMTIATSGVGSATHMTLERFKAATGANITHVPYRGGGALTPDLLGGSISGAMTEFSTALPMHNDKKAHIVAIAALHRSKLAPDIPTFDESGVKGFTAQSFIGILAPAKTPDAIVAQIQGRRREGPRQRFSGRRKAGRPRLRSRHARTDDGKRLRRLHPKPTMTRCATPLNSPASSRPSQRQLSPLFERHA